MNLLVDSSAKWDQQLAHSMWTCSSPPADDLISWTILPFPEHLGTASAATPNQRGWDSEVTPVVPFPHFSILHPYSKNPLQIN